MQSVKENIVLLALLTIGSVVLIAVHALAQEHQGVLAKADIPALIAALGDPDEGVRTGARKKLVEIGPAAIEALAPALKSEDLTVRYHATLALGEIATEQAIPPLAEMLADSNVFVRREAVKALASIGGLEVASHLLTAMKDDDESVRQSAGYALRQMKEAHAAELLVGALLSDDAVIRRSAAEALNLAEETQFIGAAVAAVRKRRAALGQSNPLTVTDPQLVPLLIELLKGSDAKERRGAAIVLAVLARALPAEPLVKALSDLDPMVRLSVSVALAEMGERALPALTDALNDPDREIRSGAATALGLTRDTRSLEHLVEALEDPWPATRIAAARSLARINDPRGIGPILLLLRDPEPIVRWSIIHIISRTRNTAATAFLIERLRDPEPFIRAAAARALGSMKDPTSVEPLIEALNGRETTVIFAASQSLESITRQRLGIDPDRWRAWFKRNAAQQAYQ